MKQTIAFLMSLIFGIVLLILGLILALGPTEIKYPELLPPGMSVEEATKRIKPSAWLCVVIALIMVMLGLWGLGIL